MQHVTTTKRWDNLIKAKITRYKWKEWANESIELIIIEEFKTQNKKLNVQYNIKADDLYVFTINNTRQNN